MDPLMDLDTSLVPPVYVAWALWEQGERVTAIDTVADCLSDAFGSDVLGATSRRLARPSFQRLGLFAEILSEPLALSVPPADVAAAFWRQAPRSETLRAILLSDYRWSEDPFEAQTTEVPGVEVLTALIRTHERQGLLSRDTREIPFGGRPVLTEELIAAEERMGRGGVFQALQTPVEPALDAGAWWNQAAALIPRWVLRTFIHDAFVHGDGRNGEPSRTWQTIRSLHPPYAAAVITSWEALLGVITTAEWDAAARSIARSPGLNMRSQLEQVLTTG